ncbi:hypothetical protein ALP03_200154 [Pseudomonas amygdali pv. tabaci]|uniref:Uncharacterized protein n=1 Tax=Pseudomonas amygdali pv. tabaci TaxID=322 RepID=A0A3M6GMT5_PSEAJ|nr:hypothetical protein ALP03_200154 [Pseudomonas amygdali pv. tabaci]
MSILAKAGIENVTCTTDIVLTGLLLISNHKCSRWPRRRSAFKRIYRQNLLKTLTLQRGTLSVRHYLCSVTLHDFGCRTHTTR